MIHPILNADRLGFTTSSGNSILRDITLEVSDGDRLAIVGPNGAGKTTLLQLLSGMVRPTAGVASLLGRSISAMRGAERARQVAVVSQTDQPDRRIHLRDYVGLGRIPHGTRLARNKEARLIEATLERTGLTSLSDREMGSLSGGERQRAQIARALVQEPRILFLDEPTNHLDPRARGMVLSLVGELNLTIVAVLHDLHLVPGFATKVAILQNGDLVACGTVADTLSRSVVHTVFGIDLLRFPHPHEDREITVFDIPLTHDIGVYR